MENTEKSRSFWNALLMWGLHACRASDRQLSRLMGRSDDYVGYSRRNRKKGPTLDDAFRLIEAIGLPDWVVFGKLFPPPSRPAELLERLWQHTKKRGSPAPLFFPAAGEIPDLAIGRLEKEIDALLGACQTGPQADPGALGDLAYALAIWGDSRRSHGCLDSAFRACHLALDLAERSEDRWVLGQCLWNGALLLADLGFAEYGLPWLEKAAALFALERRGEDLPALLAAQGLLLIATGRQEAGLRCLREAVGLLPAGERRWRHAALLELAAAAQEAGKNREALADLEVLDREQEGSSFLQGVIRWRQAGALLGLGDKEPAVEAYRRAIAQVGDLGDPADALSLLCDAGEQLIRHGEAAVAGQLAAILLGAWKNRAAAPRLAEIVEDLHALGRMRPLAEIDLQLARHRLKALSPQAGEFRLPRP